MAFTLASDDGRFLVVADATLRVEVETGVYWRTVEIVLDGDDTLPDGHAGPASSASLSVRWAEGEPSAIALWAETGRDTRELMLWFST